MNLLLIAAVLIAAALLALYFHGRAYARRVEARWPPIGRFVEVDGVRLHIIERGRADAPPILFLHGATANAREFLNFTAALEADYRVLIIDRPGYGYSERPRRSERLAVQARLLAHALERESEGPALIVCHSLGCASGLRIAVERPDLVDGLVLISPASHPYPWPNAWWARLAAAPLIGPLFCATLVPAIAPSASRSAIRNTFHPAQPTQDYVEDGGVGLAFRAGAFRASARDVVATKREFITQAPLYTQIDAPAVIVTADKDRVVSPRIHAQALARDIPTAELITLPGAGHMPHRVRPDAILASIHRVQEIGAARRAD
ncbi:MAG: alpha/beta fold hydrolase [Hyphomonadaceae bacterium]